MSVRTIDELKSDISIEDVLVEVGGRIQLQAWGQDLPFYCPFHVHNDDTPSGSVNVMKGLFKCFACDVGGSVIDLALLHLESERGHQTTISEAMNWLEETFC